MLLSGNYTHPSNEMLRVACSVCLVAVLFASGRNGLDPHSSPCHDSISSAGLDLGTCHLLLVIGMAKKQFSGNEEFQPWEAKSLSLNRRKDLTHCSPTKSLEEYQASFCPKKKL